MDAGHASRCRRLRGLGVKFLDKAFGEGAPPNRRIHQRAAREVLNRLLPASGVDIKGTRALAQRIAHGVGLRRSA